MKQSTSNTSPKIGTIVDTIMICVVLICLTDTGLSVVVAEGKAAPDTGDGPVLRVSCTSPFANRGTTGDGGKEAVHLSYPIQELRDEYLASRNTLKEEVIAVGLGITSYPLE